MNVFIFHGTMGSPEANWFPWLERELKGLGLEVLVPRFPTPEGPGFFLRLLERRTSPIKAAILAAPFDGFIGEEPYDTLNKTFIDHPFDKEFPEILEEIKTLCG
ncbi:MAG: hypothetical protein V1810_04035 [Candidatus Beckwithbacteria bacterium]